MEAVIDRQVSLVPAIYGHFTVDIRAVLYLITRNRELYHLGGRINAAQSRSPSVLLLNLTGFSN